ncbi:MAG: alpha/beta fold hydrolase [Bacteroidetes bacterium]|nr:alpha/beta fold hydrolase [Bacteroidota bacterium]
MPTTWKIIIKTLKLLAIFYVLICIAVYFFQEKLLFFPEKLDKSYKFPFNQPFEEINIPTDDNNTLHGLLFTSDQPKGLIFYLHGNGGALNDWGEVAKRYTDLHYDVFMLDYPGYGKSTGSIKSKMQLLNSVQAAYNLIKKKYTEEQIVVLGYSLGTGPAAYLASANHPKRLILQAPYYNLTDMARHAYPILPVFLLRYKFQTNEYLRNCHMPVVIFHGDGDEVIYYGSSLKLKQEMKAGDTLITLHGQGHNGITDNPEYIAAIGTILN